MPIQRHACRSRGSMPSRAPARAVRNLSNRITFRVGVGLRNEGRLPLEAHLRRASGRKSDRDEEGLQSCRSEARDPGKGTSARSCRVPRLSNRRKSRRPWQAQHPLTRFLRRTSREVRSCQRCAGIACQLGESSTKLMLRLPTRSSTARQGLAPSGGAKLDASRKLLVRRFNELGNVSHGRRRPPRSARQLRRPFSPVRLRD